MDVNVLTQKTNNKKRKTKRSFYVNELYDDKLKMIQRNNNISTLSSSIVFLIDYYIKNENKKDEIKEDENNQKNDSM